MELTLDANSGASKESRSPQSESAESSNPATKFYIGKINQLDKSPLTRLIG